MCERTGKIETLEQLVDVLRKENESLKSEIEDLKAENDELLHRPE